MPQGEDFWNPYRMIPVRKNIDRKPPFTDEKFRGKSGIISCSLENLTPLFIGGNHDFKENFLKRNGKCVIPGSSLKGMLRSLAEIVGGGCMVTDSKGSYNKTYAACNKVHSLCIACRIFGMMERGRNARVHKGNVSIGDALLEQAKPETVRFQVLLSSCGTRHEPFYRTQDTGKLDGKSRKFFFHQPKRRGSVPNVPENLRSRAWHINALTPGKSFDFEVQFSNLSKEELELLIYVLVLEENVDVMLEQDRVSLQGPLRHKIGNAKPLGLGSCHIRINKLVCFADSRDRFACLGDVKNNVYEGGDGLEREISVQTERFVEDKSETMQQLRKMMVWDENDNREFRYPDYFWFKSLGNSQKVLKKI
ncbi:MAG: hypothetical protein GY795_37055 [Desulfobacterales bacterium]|nr:hypothetical protein [Desulfobacterales bacterium]